MYSNYQNYSHTLSARRILNGVLLGFIGLAVAVAWLLIR